MREIILDIGENTILIGRFINDRLIDTYIAPISKH